MLNTMLEYYDIYPKVLLAGKKTKITIRPLGGQAEFSADEGYNVCVLPLKETLAPNEGRWGVWENYPLYDVELKDGCITFTHMFEREQEYYVRIFKKSDTERKDRLQFRVYALDEDLYSRRPYMGDLHVHSTRSDGKESPNIVMATYRKNGFDFTALTDHRNYKASIEAQDVYKDAAIDMLICTGEEVHLPGNHVHIVSFGANRSITDYTNEDLDRFNREVQQIIDSSDIPANVNAHAYAATVWGFERIREFGGIAIFPHPHWNYNVYNVQDALTDLLFANKAFDAFEVLGGISFDDNNTQVAYYNEARAKGWDVPVVGSSDSHGQINAFSFNMRKTVVFAKDLSYDSIREAILNKYSVAVEQAPGENARVHGYYRYVAFVQFLLSEYFPVHQEMCFEEGRQMKNYSLGCPKAKQLLEMLSGRTKAYLDKVYAKTYE